MAGRIIRSTQPLRRPWYLWGNTSSIAAKEWSNTSTSSSSSRELSSSSGSNEGPLPYYHQLVQRKKIEMNEQQIKAVEHLQRVYSQAMDFQKCPENYTKTSYKFIDFHIEKETIVDAPKGLYLYGGVGTGKTFLMDLFYEQLPIKRKRRVYFNQFMLEVHDRLHKLRQKGHRGDPLSTVTEDLYQQAWLLCFDEFQVTDVADAMLLKRLFTGMLERGSVVVSTSNRPPSDLYLNGLQRELFLPFIDLLKVKHEVYDINSTLDFRLVHRAYGVAADSIFVLKHHPPPAEQQDRSGAAELRDPQDCIVCRSREDEARYGFKQALKQVTKGQELTKLALRLPGRKLYAPQVALSTRTGAFTFQELCGQPLGAADYIALSKTFSTIFLSDVPVMTLTDQNKLRRFIVLVDCLYEGHSRLVMFAEAQPEGLFDVEANKDSAQDEVFAFKRTASRLLEMQGSDFNVRSHRNDAAELVTLALKEGDRTSTSSPSNSERVERGEAAGGGEEGTWEAVWRYYDLDDQHTPWDQEKLKAFLQDFSEVRYKRRDVIAAGLVKELYTTWKDVLKGPKAFQVFMQEGGGVEGIDEVLKKVVSGGTIDSNAEAQAA